ncbi:MAG: methyltransferase domain-containing protein [Saprospiraceae bacterium]|nr:methyltransferase domain-containing protein [Saprospiraceae bacterium]
MHHVLVEAVVNIIIRVFNDQMYADKVIEQTLKSNRKWGARDRAFIAENAYHIIRYFRLYQEMLGYFPASKSDFWLLFANHCIVNNIKLPVWQEFKNFDDKLAEERFQILRKNVAISQSIPDWLHILGQQELGDKWLPCLEKLNQPAEVVLRCNTLKSTVSQLQEKLQKEGIETLLIGHDALQLIKRKNIFSSKSFQEGLFEIQDFSSQQVSSFMDVESGMRVIDACAGAGGKSLHLAALMQNKGTIIALDTEQWKLEELKKRAKRAGISIIESRWIDTNKVVKRLKESADFVLLDVPCSGLGVLRRNPDAKWKLSLEQIEKTKILQKSILQNYSTMVKKYGFLVYATCSILPGENNQQVEYFLSQNSDFQLVKDNIIMPQVSGYDGFYMAKMQRL